MSLRDRVGAEIFRKVAGPDGPRQRERVHSTPGPRWFEPGSPITRVHGDASMFVGGIRAIMLQSLHPAAMQGVADHSGYRGDMWGRLAQVSTYIAMTTFGAESDARAVIRAVQRAHESVTGTMPDGTPYAASDPHLLGWVHAAEIDSFLVAHDRFGQRPLVGLERDEYVAQAAHVAAVLGVVDPPTSESGLRATLAAYAPELRGTPAARDAISFLVWHPDLPLAARPAYLSLVGAAVSLTSESARRELGLPHPPVLDKALDQTVGRALGKVSTGAIRWAMTSGREQARTMEEARA
ncbi:oxygenase MpaB family protein [Nocardioides hwasunensis]|uniref:oxygenase MpaB family protein n=1 Tax=Nocardioides hwasunensis TaxID=397258 RepID=UPI00296437DE|nr:oxygenase MpaB family protein [Nocardioides hwasunensis]